MITSGSVFVFDENESGHEVVDQWLFLSPSRVLGNCLVSGSDEHSAFECGGRLIVKPVKYPYLRVRVHGMHSVEKLDTITITMTTVTKIPRCSPYPW